MSMPPPNQRTLGEKLQAFPKAWLYFVLILATAVPLFFKINVPNKPLESSIDLYAALSQLKPGSTVLLSSDWTTSTRGESGGAFDAVIRILMNRGVKFALFSGADGQAPQVATDEIEILNQERLDAGLRPYERWNDWVNLGFFPGLEGTTNGLTVSVQSTFSGKKDIRPDNVNADVTTSPVLANVKTLKDVALFLDITASNTSVIYVQRLSGKVALGYLVTGVMGPETQPYYSSGQLVGYSSGIKGVYDLETMMQNGVNSPGPDGQVAVTSSKHPEVIPPLPGKNNLGKASLYYPALHFALALLIVSVVIGNIGMFLSKREARTN